jgi:hypothetical protein
MTYDADNDDIRAYLGVQYGDEKLDKIVINCVITQITILQQVRTFKTKNDMFEAIDDCTRQYMSIANK